MLKSLTNSAVSKNHLSIWLLVLLSALFQLPVSASSSEFISHERVELVESSTFNQVELVHILAGSFIRQVPDQALATTLSALTTRVQKLEDDVPSEFEPVFNLFTSF